MPSTILTEAIIALFIICSAVYAFTPRDYFLRDPDYIQVPKVGSHNAFNNRISTERRSRICPSLNIAERSLNLLVAEIGWACTKITYKVLTYHCMTIPVASTRSRID
jgi:hypothetical protein